MEHQETYQRYCHPGKHWVGVKEMSPGAAMCRGCRADRLRKQRYKREKQQRSLDRRRHNDLKTSWQGVTGSVEKLFSRIRRLKYRDAESARWVEEALVVAYAIREVVREAVKKGKNHYGWAHWRDVVPYKLRDRAWEVTTRYPVKTGYCPFVRRD